jgi:uncharacterized membrane protein
MIESVYALLAKVGFHHPLHPALTHIPMGMVMGCFFFGLLLWYTGKPVFRTTCLHCSILGLVFIIPTVIAGIFDWQHLYAGRLQALIILKMVLAVVLTGLLGYSVAVNRKDAGANKLLLVYTFCLLCAIGLGFSGGQLIYGG